MIEYLKKHIIWVLVFGIILMGLFFVTGLLVKNWPYITLDTEFKITDVLNIILTVAVALLIPVYIKYFIDQGSKVSEMVLGEVTRYRDHLELMHQRFFAIYQSGAITDANKSEINIYCEMLDSKFEILTTILETRSNNRVGPLIEELKTNQIEFWRALTNIEINSAAVGAIHPNTFVKGVKCHQNLTETIMKINLAVTRL
ncbi:hypothetical protein [uncultured Maribacter sp.]|uniref:hypothetical protein n=1 Tax=uncultured Maribacter sp. TaxID=431308 RepID=UPI0026202C33|nr:hypothetical protein [uncultured Maribacter sp.]